MTVAVVTSCYGAYDEITEPPRQDIDAEWIAVTDGQVDVPAGWREVVEPRPNVADRLAAKVAKTQPWLYTEADTIVWMDASCRFLGGGSLRRLLEVAPQAPMSQFVHPDRDCALAEAEFSAPLLKYAHQPVAEQAASYVAEGHKPHVGLWATGVIVYRVDLDEDGLRAFGAMWLAEQVRWTDQDQVSQVPVAHRTGWWVGTIPGYLWVNEFLTWAPHRRAD